MTPSICFVGLENLPVLAPEYGAHGAGGAQVQQTLLAKALVRRGFRVSMVVADYGQPDGAQWSGITTYKAFRHDAGLPGLRFVFPRWTTTWSAMKRADSDIYYVSCAGMLIGQVSLFARLHGRKAIFRIASDSDCDPRTVLIRHWRDKKLYAFGLHRADLVLAQTEKQQLALQGNFGRSSRIARSLADLHGSDRRFSERDIDVLWVSNIQPLKRPDRFLDLARSLPHRRFHMVGGPMSAHASLYSDIQQRCATLPNVQFHGKISYHEINSYFERTRILVNTSDIEGFPNTYLQAWAHGAPVAAFHDPNGFVAGHRLGAAVLSDEDLTKAVEDLLSDEEHWRDANARCVEFMRTRYGDDMSLREYEAAFQQLNIGKPA